MQNNTINHIKIIASLNLLASLYYAYLFVGTLSVENWYQQAIYFISSVGMFLAGLLLLIGKKEGIIVTQLIGLIGVVAVINVITFYSISFLLNPLNISESAIENFTVNFFVYLIRHFYPIFVSIYLIKNSKRTSPDFLIFP